MTIVPQYLLHEEIDFRRWDAAIDRADNGLPYAYSWYLNITAQHKWDAIIGGDYQWVFPLPYNQKLAGVRQVFQPVLSQQLGLFGESLTPDILRSFLKAIPPHFKKRIFNLNSAVSVLHGTSLPMRRRINLLVPMQRDYTEIHAAYSRSLKKRLRRAAEKYRLETVTDVDFLIRYYRQHLERQVNLQANDYELIRQLIPEILRRQKGEIWQVVNENGAVDACGLFVLSHDRVINLFGASGAGGKQGFAMHFLLDALIRRYASTYEIFDFEGSEIEGIAAFFRSFGAIEEYYYQHYWEQLPLWLGGLLRMRSLLQGAG